MAINKILIVDILKGLIGKIKAHFIIHKTRKIMAAKERVGVVVSNKMDKTIVVAIENRSAHPKYGKTVVKTKKYKVHDEENKCNEGDRVRITETRPMSRTKRWQLAEILNTKIS